MPARHNWVDGDALTSTRLNAFGHLISYVNGSTSDQTGIGASATDVTGLSITWTAESGRLYLIVASVAVQQLTANGNATVTITDGAGTVAARRNVTLGTNEYDTVWVPEFKTGLAGSVTRKVRAFTSSGSLTVQGAGQTYGSFAVLDLGNA